MDVYRAQLTALDTLQHGLPRDAQCLHGGPHREPARWRLLGEKSPQLVGQPDLPWSAWCELLAANEAILKPTVQRGRRYAQLMSSFGHREQLPIRWVGGRLVTWNVAVRTQASN